MKCKYDRKLDPCFHEPWNNKKPIINPLQTIFQSAVNFAEQKGEGRKKNRRKCICFTDAK
jgi:hypothetical protein